MGESGDQRLVDCVPTYPFDGWIGRNPHLVVGEHRVSTAGAVLVLMMLEAAEHHGVEAPLLAHRGVDVLDLGGVPFVERHLGQTPAAAVAHQENVFAARMADD